MLSIVEEPSNLFCANVLQYLHNSRSQLEMWMLVCFFLPALLFCICAFLAWLRVLYVSRRRQKREKGPYFSNERRPKGEGEVVCSIPIRVLDFETGKTFIYSSNEDIRPEV
ncbi:hypothetical protein Q1695_001420 [Nippostrongylus brasiliensis]|nr:hypothetical protein Q1695_001420 [Nippostrongylus brasiliensis]